jgi:formylglycine-generating enzyme required for sulfatase activity
VGAPGLLTPFTTRKLALVAACLQFTSACSGEPFRLADGAGGGFTQLTPTDHLGDAGPGAGGTSSASSEPDPSAGGELRPDTSADDGESCIEAGTFTMGESEVNPPQTGGYLSHGPEHSVTLSAFILDTKEVTVARYRACVDVGACTAPREAADQGCTFTAAAGDQDRLPVTCVSWDDAITFCTWDSRRLPTEAEWERAARGTTGTAYAWGDDSACSNAVFGAGSSCPMYQGTMPQPVGSTPRGASREGALDLTGNAWEWVADWFGPYSRDAVTDPTGPSSGSTRIQRGGNWQTPPASARAFMRRAEVPGAIGPTSFRCARSLDAGSLGRFEL